MTVNFIQATYCVKYKMYVKLLVCSVTISKRFHWILLNSITIKEQKSRCVLFIPFFSKHLFYTIRTHPPHPHPHPKNKLEKHTQKAFACIWGRPMSSLSPSPFPYFPLESDKRPKLINSSAYAEI